MNLKNRRRLLWLLNGVLLLCAAGAVAYALSPLADLEVSANLPLPAEPSNPLEASASLAPLEAYSQVWQRELRKPLFDQSRPSSPVRSAPLPRIQLAGTVIENEDRGYAVFRSGDGHTHLVCIGEGIEGAVLVGVNTTSATIEFSGRTVTLQVEGRRPAK